MVNHFFTVFLGDVTTAMSNQELFCCLAVLSVTRNTSTGGYDPGQGAVGRFGGVRVVDRRSRRPHDHAFITAYAPQETAPESEKQAFFTQLQQTIHGLPARSGFWLLGDLNAHIGLDLCSSAVGPVEPAISNDNGNVAPSVLLQAWLW